MINFSDLLFLHVTLVVFFFIFLLKFIEIYSIPFF